MIILFLEKSSRPGPFSPACRFHLGLTRRGSSRRTARCACPASRRGASLSVWPTTLHGHAAGGCSAIRVACRCGAPRVLQCFRNRRSIRPSDTTLQVTLAQSGVTVDIGAGDTIIDVLRANGIDVETSCEQGICGTQQRISGLEGTPEHRDRFLTSQEKAQGNCMAICISRSKSPRLVLDL